MPLTWNVSKVKDHERITSRPDDPLEWSPVTTSLASALMAAGIGRITEKNVDEVIERVSAWQEVTGALLGAAITGPIYITAADIREHVGMSTNVSTKTRHEFERDLMRAALRRVSARAAPKSHDGKLGGFESAREVLEELAARRLAEKEESAA